MASAGSTFSAARIAITLDATQMRMTATKPAAESSGSSRTYFGKIGAQNVAVILPTTKPIYPSAMACCRISPAMVRFLVPMSLSTAISRILPSVSV